jgi:tetratricopeptide (TPR) repeat protein
MIKNISRLLLLGLLVSCTVTKQKGDISNTKRLYHNITSEYNGYFNANELIVKSKANLIEQVPNDYSRLLPIFPYVEAPNASSVYADCDVIVEKMARIVALHGPGYWIDDCYLMVGVAQFLKQDYETAETSLLYFQQEFEQGSQRKSAKISRAQKAKMREVQQKEREKEVKERAKERELNVKEREKTKKQLQKERQKAIKEREKASKRGSSGSGAPPREARKEKEELANKPAGETPSESKQRKTLDQQIAQKQEEKEKEQKKSEKYEGKFKHRIVYDEGLLWLAKTYVVRKQYLTAQRLLRRLNDDPDLDAATRLMTLKTYAFFHIEQDEYAQAIPFLKEAILLEKKKAEKARLTYITAQLYEKNKRYSDAQFAYLQVAAMKPDYDLFFSAQVNAIIAEWKGSTASINKAIEDLEKLSKDGKNIDYEDRIYFYIGEIEMENLQEGKAVKSYKKSVKVKSPTPTYRAMSYRRLGDYFYEKENFLPAKLYYDSTLLLMNDLDPEKKLLESKRNSIREIANSMQAIQLQDSLIRISKMNPEEQEALALEIRNKRLQEKLEKEKEAAAKVAKAGMGGGRPQAQAVGFAGGGNSAPAKSEFFAYDEKLVRKGQRDFDNKWGNRALQDDWRRSRRSGAEEKSVEGVGGSLRAMKKSISKSEIEKILEGVPRNEQEMKACLKIIESSTFQLGKLYREKLEDYTKSIAILEELLEKHPETTHELESFFLLYLNYTEIGDYAKANYYKQQIFKKHKNSELAKALSSQISGEKSREEKAADDYDVLYQTFQKGDHPKALELAKSGEKTYQGMKVQAKFALLGAMSTGNVEGREAYVTELKRVVSQYKGSPEQIKAAEILRLLGQASSSTDGKISAVEAENIFKPEDDKFHYAMLIWREGNSSFEQAKNTVSNFNSKYYRLENLKISSITLDINSGTQLLLIRTFTNAEKAMKYFNEAQKRISEYIPNPEQGELFVITQNNYREILKKREADLYRNFFTQHYLNR